MNLLQELGIDWVRGKLQGCMFYMPDKTPAMIDCTVPWKRDEVAYIAVGGATSKPTITKGVLPADYFKDFSVFQTPALGWRTANFGRYAAYFRRRNNTYNRALNAKSLASWLSPTTQFLAKEGGISLDFYTKDTTQTSMVMSPNYKPLEIGIKAMRDGKIFSFCVSPNIAVLPEAANKEALYYNTTKVGSIKPNGQIDCSLPQVMAVLKDNA